MDSLLRFTRFLRGSLVGGALLAAALAISAQGAFAASVAELVAGAKKETTIKGLWSATSFGGSRGLSEFVAGMNKKYGLNIKAEFTPGPNMQGVMAKLAAEAAAGQPASSDVYMGNSQAVHDAMKVNVLKPVEWASILDRPLSSEPGFDPYAPGNIGVGFASTFVGVLYNTDRVKGDDIPRRLEDVLKPKWKGKIASTPYAAGLREFAMPDMLGREHMVSFTNKLSKQIAGLMRCGEPDRITSGEFLMLVLTCGGDDAIVLQRTGAPIGHTLLAEGTIIHTRYAGVPKNSTSPNAAALLIAYMLTPEGQALLWKYDGMDFHILPNTNMKKELDKVRAAGGKVVVNSPQWLGSVKGYREMQKELEGILRGGK
jgi:ABC-type Fe3+ transport system substrate-binding protein